ncbi:MAG: hypothetical protein ACRDH1_08850 [Actinomycetota bacterium]
MGELLTLEQTERALAGTPGARDDSRVTDAAAALAAIRRALLEQPAPVGAWRQLAAIRALAPSPPGVKLELPSPPRRRVGRGVRVAAVGLAATMALVLGLGVAGALPEPIQDAVARVAGLVGLDLPDSGERVPIPSRPANEEQPTPAGGIGEGGGTGGSSEGTPPVDLGGGGGSGGTGMGGGGGGGAGGSPDTGGPGGSGGGGGGTDGAGGGGSGGGSPMGGSGSGSGQGPGGGGGGEGGIPVTPPVPPTPDDIP